MESCFLQSWKAVFCNHGNEYRNPHLLIWLGMLLLIFSHKNTLKSAE